MKHAIVDETRLLEDAKAKKRKLHLLHVVVMCSHADSVLLRVSFFLLKPACVSNPCQEA